MFAVGDVVWQAAIAAGLALGMAWIGFKVQSIAKTNDVIHTLVNSNMGIQLKLNRDLSRWKASQTKKKEDVEAANLAENMLREHEANQAIIDGEKDNP